MTARSFLQKAGEAIVNIAAHIASTSNPHNVTKAQVGLGSANNTSDADKPISIAQAASIDSKEPSIATGSNAQYWRGDKGWRDFATDVRAAVLTGLSLATSTAVVAGDTILAAIGKLQAQVSLRATSATPTFTGQVTMDGTYDKPLVLGGLYLWKNPTSNLLLYKTSAPANVSDGQPFQLVAAPASAGAAGFFGQIAIADPYIYVCVATNAWRRVAVAGW